MISPLSSSFQILLVEDNRADAGLAIRAIKSGTIACDIHHAKDGVEAMEFLQRSQDRFKDAPRPDLILLDLNMPRKDGREVLGELKEDPKLKSIPVIVLTTSDAERDIQVSYSRGANSFVTKPMDVEDFFNLIHGVQHYWFQLAKLPK